MSEEKPSENTVADEFRQLGKNLTDVLRGVWDSPERKKLRQEIANGLNELSNTMRREVEYMRESPTRQRLKAEAEELRSRIRMGEYENKARQELIAALHSINEQLTKAIQRWSEEPSAKEATARPEVHPDEVDSSANMETGRSELPPDDVEPAHGGDVPGSGGMEVEEDK
jgi:hypothetical protein